MSTQQVIETLTCGRCGRLISVSAPFLADPPAVEVRDQEVGTRITLGRICPVHGTQVILWNRRFVDIPPGASQARGTFDDGWRAAEMAVLTRRWWGRRAHEALEQARINRRNGDPAR